MSRLEGKVAVVTGAGRGMAALDERVVEAMLGVNLLGPLYVASEAARRLQSGGRIVNISSSLAKFPLAGSSVYSATKTAIQTFTESWAKELGPAVVAFLCSPEASWVSGAHILANGAANT